MTKLTIAKVSVTANIDTINTKQTKAGNPYFEILIIDNVSDGQYPTKATYRAFVKGAKETPTVCPYNVGDLIDIDAKHPVTKNEKINDKYESLIDCEWRAKIELIEKAPVVDATHDDHSSIASDDIPF